MKREVLWTESALEEVANRIAYVAARNPAAARKVYSEINKAGNQPGSAATGLPYSIAYALSPKAAGGERVVIIHVVHTSQNWAEGDWPA